MWKSRKFRALVLDTVFSLATFGITTLLAPEYQAHALAFIGIIQPAVLAYVLGTAWEDAAAKRVNGYVATLEEYGD